MKNLLWSASILAELRFRQFKIGYEGEYETYDMWEEAATYGFAAIYHYLKNF